MFDVTDASRQLIDRILSCADTRTLRELYVQAIHDIATQYHRQRTREDAEQARQDSERERKPNTGRPRSHETEAMRAQSAECSQLWADGRTLREIATITGLHQSTVVRRLAKSGSRAVLTHHTEAVKSEVNTLRREGLSILEISAQVGINKTTIATWCLGVPRGSQLGCHA